MDLQVCNNSISRFLGMKGKSRLEIKNEITEYFLNLDFPEITFLESKRVETDYGEWEEIYILTQMTKIDSPEFIKFITFQIDLIMKILRKFGVKDCGIQEFDCSDNTYNVLIYILNNGKDKERCKKNEYEELFGNYQQ